MARSDLPVAVRATAEKRRSPLGQRRTFRYDARYSDGRVETDVDVDDVLQGRRLLADARATRDAAEATCPEEGAGKWVEYATGRVLPDEP